MASQRGHVGETGPGEATGGEGGISPTGGEWCRGESSGAGRRETRKRRMGEVEPPCLVKSIHKGEQRLSCRPTWAFNSPRQGARRPALTQPQHKEMLQAGVKQAVPEGRRLLGGWEVESRGAAARLARGRAWTARLSRCHPRIRASK